MGREQYCPNMFYDTNQVSIGEFNTLQECMDFPIRDIWCINREEDNLFEKYKSQGNRVLIICCWERSDKWRFVVAIVKDGNAKYFDFNDLPMDLVQSDFETYIGKDAVATIKGLNECTIYNKETNENKIMNKKQVIRLNERQLRQIVTESVKRVLNEIGDTPKGQYMLGKLAARQEGNNDRRFLNTSHYAFGKRVDAAQDELNNTNDKQKWADSFNDLTDAYNCGSGHYEDRIAQDYYKKKGWQ